MRVPMSAAGAQWDSDDARFVREFMEALADEAINEVTAMCSAQSAKTLTLLCMLAYWMAVDPGPILWVTSNLDEAKKLAKSRLLPLLRMCAPVAEILPEERGMVNTLQIYFPGGMLILAGSNSEASLVSTPYRYILLDEVRTYPPGALELVDKRTTSYPNYKKVMISTPDMEGDAVDTAHAMGDQRIYEVPCPHCAHIQALRWGEKDVPGGIKWDTNDLTHPPSGWNFPELDKTIHYECESCRGRINPTIDARKDLQRHGQWRRRNPNAPTNIASFSWNAILPWWTRWDRLVHEYLQAVRRLKYGDHQPLKRFYNEALGLPFADRLKYAKSDDFISQRESAYDPMAPYDQEKRRFMMIDVQAAGGRNFFWVIRAWAMGGASRLIAFGQCWNIEELRATAKLYNVQPQNVGIDSGTFTAEVYQYIIESGLLPNGSYAWKAMKGDKAKWYLDEDGVRVLTTWSFVDPYSGTAQANTVRPIGQILFSKSGMLDRVELAMHGLVQPWLIPEGADNLDEYKRQCTAYERLEQQSAKGEISHEWNQIRKADHYGSCERMQSAAAMHVGLLNPPPEENKPPNGQQNEATVEG